ncbi:MAG: universal stress protein [Desulfobacterales bacterium]|nr:universal stress protein [Desulfobacterales bacterium]
MGYPKYKKILFCTDFSENSDYAFEFAYGIAKRDKGLLYILYVIPDNPHRKFAENVIPRETLETIDKEFKETLINNYREHYIKKIENGVPFKIVAKSGREDAEIIKFAKEENADIVVMGTHSRTGIQHAIIGSVAEKVLRHSPIPVFVIPPRVKS